MLTQKDISLLKTIFLTRNECEEIIEQIIDKDIHALKKHTNF